MRKLLQARVLCGHVSHSVAASTILVLDIEAVGAELWQKVRARRQTSSSGRGTLRGLLLRCQQCSAVRALAFSVAISSCLARVCGAGRRGQRRGAMVHELWYTMGACGGCLSDKQWGTNYADTWQRMTCLQGDGSRDRNDVYVLLVVASCSSFGGTSRLGGNTYC